MIIKGTIGAYTITHSDTYFIRNIESGDICAKAHDVEPAEYEETTELLDPTIEMRDALSILGVQT